MPICKKLPSYSAGHRILHFSVMNMIKEQRNLTYRSGKNSLKASIIFVKADGYADKPCNLKTGAIRALGGARDYDHPVLSQEDTSPSAYIIVDAIINCLKSIGGAE